MSNYLDATNDLYKAAALTPDVGLCCTTTPIWKFPGLEIPMIMQEMNYGCGSTISAQDLINNPKIVNKLFYNRYNLLNFFSFLAHYQKIKGKKKSFLIVERLL